MSKAIVFDQAGPANVLRYIDVPDKKPAPNEVFIRHTAIEVNFIDIYHRTGQYQLNTNPKIPGVSAVGVVEQYGSDVKDLNIGDRVGYATSLIGGAYSQTRCIPAHLTFRIPDDISDKVAASCLVKGLTAHFLANRAYLVGPNKNVLIHAAAGGVGQLLSQWCNHLGAKVIGTVGSDNKKEIALKNGCHEVVNYKTENWVQKVLDFTEGFGIHCVYDSVGKDVCEGNLQVLVEIGLYILYGQSSGAVQMDVTRLAPKSLFFTRPSLFSYKKNRTELVMSALELFTKIREKHIKPSIFMEFPLEKAAEAHMLLESRKALGSIILIP
jgi:NADPH2:quinone reductase